MIRPASEIEYPPSEALCVKASMLARMEALSDSSNALMNVIAERVGAQAIEDEVAVASLTAEQDRLIANMKSIIRS